jgi:regulator of replication initiation timing
METMKLMYLGKELELTAQEVQNKLDELVYENSQLELEKEELKKQLKQQKESSDMWWNSYQDEQKRNARIRKAIEAAKTVLEMC